ncbi:MAG: DNA primase [Pseudomonadota bacterium]
MSTVRLPDGFLDELKARLLPSSVIGRKVKLKKQGKEWVGLSPFTNEKTPSFYVNDQKKIFKCFSSGLGGDVIKFVQETERLSFMEAVEKLADEAGMALPKATPEAKEAYDRRQKLYDACEAACRFFEETLRGSAGAGARDYLQGRGLHEAAWARHRLGFAPDEWRALIGHLRRDGFSMDEIVDAGLAVQKEGGAEPYDRFRGRVIFPIEDAQGRVIAFGGRGMTPDAKPKYLNSSDTPLFNKSQILYRYKRAREALGHGEGGGLIVCEGYMDAIALTEAGFGHAVAPLGTALTEDQLALLWRVGPEPVLCFDGDRAGLGAAHRSIDRALPHLQPGRSLFFTLLPDGLDPDDVIRQRGRAEMDNYLESAIPLAQLLWERELAFDSVDTPERQAGLDQRLKAAAGQIKHAGVRTAYERDLRRRMNDYLWSQRARRKASNLAAPLKAESKTAGLGLVARVLDNPVLMEVGGELLARADFPNTDTNAIRNAIFDLLDQNQPLDRTEAKAHLERLGRTRASKLLDDYPIAPPITPDGPEGREWLIALEQFGASDGSDEDGAGHAEDDANTSLLSWKRRHRRVAERRAMRARINEAAEEADQN